MHKRKCKKLDLMLLSNPENLGSVRRQVQKFAAELDLPEWCQTQIMLAVDESLTNIIRHAYNNKANEPIELCLSLENCILEISIRDFAQFSDPSNFQTDNKDRLTPGGLGVEIMRKCMDKVEYSPVETGGTLLKMTKRLNLANLQSPENKDVNNDSD